MELRLTLSDETVNSGSQAESLKDGCSPDWQSKCGIFRVVASTEYLGSPASLRLANYHLETP